MIKLKEILYVNEKSDPSLVKSKKFVRKVRSDILPILLKQAKFIISAIKQEKKPSDPDVLNQMKYFMRHYTGQNPLQSLDTYGVILVMNHLLKDPKMSGKAKKFYKQAVDAWLKSL